MAAVDISTVIFICILSTIFLVLGITHIMGKGPPLNNAYLYASKNQRKTMDKRPFYRQSAVVFFLMSAVFTVIALSFLLSNDRVLLLEIPLMGAAVVYSVVSSIRIHRDHM